MFRQRGIDFLSVRARRSGTLGVASVRVERRTVSPLGVGATRYWVSARRLGASAEFAGGTPVAVVGDRLDDLRCVSAAILERLILRGDSAPGLA